MSPPRQQIAQQELLGANAVFLEISRQFVAIVSDFANMAPKMGAMEATQAIFIDEFKRERDIAASHRADIRQDIVRMGQAIGTMMTDVAKVTEGMGRIEDRLAAALADIQEFKTARAEVVGAAKLGRFVWAIASGLGGGAVAILGVFIGKML